MHKICFTQTVFFLSNLIDANCNDCYDVKQLTGEKKSSSSIGSLNLSFRTTLVCKTMTRTKRTAAAVQREDQTKNCKDTNFAHLSLFKGSKLPLHQLYNLGMELRLTIMTS